MKRYQRIPFEVTAEEYAPGKNLEDGYMPWSDIITLGIVSTDDLIKITEPDGVIMCPYVRSRRGIVFIREGDFVICEDNGNKHCCGGYAFHDRYKEINE